VSISTNLWLINLGWKGDSNPENLRASASHSGGLGFVFFVCFVVNIRGCGCAFCSKFF